MYVATADPAKWQQLVASSGSQSFMMAVSYRIMHAASHVAIHAYVRTCYVLYRSSLMYCVKC